MTVAEYLREHKPTCWNCDEPAVEVMTMGGSFDPTICPTLCGKCAERVRVRELAETIVAGHPFADVDAVRVAPRFPPNGRGGGSMTVVLLRRRDFHLFAYRWGMTARVRDGDDWLHFRMSGQRNAWRYPGRYSTQLEIEVWRTADGTADRIHGSKRYVRLKVAA